MYPVQPENKTVWIYLEVLCILDPANPLALPPQSHCCSEFAIYCLFAFFFLILSLPPYVGVSNRVFGQVHSFEETVSYCTSSAACCSHPALCFQDLPVWIPLSSLK